jgi:hypothetical protein
VSQTHLSDGNWRFKNTDILRNKRYRLHGNTTTNYLQGCGSKSKKSWTLITKPTILLNKLFLPLPFRVENALYLHIIKILFYLLRITITAMQSAATQVIKGGAQTEIGIFFGAFFLACSRSASVR